MIKADLIKLTPDFDWSRYFVAVGLPQVDAVNVGQPDYLNAASPTLSSKFVEENFNFNGKYLTGAQEMLPRWKRCVGATDRALGEALGQFYVEKTFTPAARMRAQEMVKNLVAALRDDLSTLPWMSDATRQRAIAKLDAFIRKIGYPDKWRSYEAVQITRGTYY